MKMRLALRRQVFGTLFLLLCTMCILRAAPGDENWDAAFGVPGANGPVTALAVFEHDVYAGGSFSQIGGINAGNVARWDGTNWWPLGGGVNGSVKAILSDGTSVYVGGAFSIAGGIAANSLARWDGTNWHDLGAQFQVQTNVGTISGGVAALARFRGALFVGGTFTNIVGTNSIGNPIYQRLGRWDGTNWSDAGFQSYGPVQALAASSTRLYVGGWLVRRRTPVDSGYDEVAQWDGTNWSSVGDLSYGGTPDGSVTSMAVSGSFLYAVGLFDRAGGILVSNLARWDGTRWSSMGLLSAVRCGPFVCFEMTSVAASGSKVFAAGGTYQQFEQWDGNLWRTLGSGLKRDDDGDPGNVSVLASCGSALYVGGRFISAGGKPSTNIARWRIPHELRIRRAADKALLSWPATGSNLWVEGSVDPASSNWSALSNPPGLHGGECVVTNPLDNTSRFFRLRGW